MRLVAIASLLVLCQDDPAKKRLEALAGPDVRAAFAAAEELQRTAGPDLLPEVLRVFKTADPRRATPAARVLECLAGPDLVPEMLDLLSKEPDRVASIASLLEMLADPRAEAALLPFLKPDRKDVAYPVLAALGTCGGKDSIAAIRAFRAAVGEPRLEEYALRQLIHLRDAGAARDVCAAAAAEKIELRNWKGDLARLGDRSILPDLLTLVRDPKTKVEPRKAALELVGILGTAEHVPLLIEPLGDRRFAEAAAAGLEARADPRAAAPLVKAMQGAPWGMPFARAVAAAPSPDAEGPLLEILNDREAYPRTFHDAVRLSVRVATPKLKATLVDLLVQGLDRDLALEVAPLVTPADHERLRAGVREGGDRGLACTLALASRGDPESVRTYVEHVAERRVQDIFVNRRQGTDTQPARSALEIFTAPPPGLLEAVTEQFGRKPHWTGAEFLALQGKGDGRKQLLEELADATDREKGRLNRALLAIREPTVVASLLKAYEGYRQDDEEERGVARAMSDEDAARVRETVRSGRLKYPQGLLRILSFRDDRESVPIFRREVRSRSAQAFGTGPLCLSLARMKDTESRPVFVRMLRDLNPARRALGARCLALLGDRTAIPALAPLLGDLQPEWMADGRIDGLARIPRVCDTAAESIAILAGLTLEGSPDERVKAAAERAARER
jgi:HEAT repeat protein